MNHLKSIFRNAFKHKWTTALNILGLTLGFTCSILLFFWVTHELNYDSFIPEKGSLYRVNMDGSVNGEHIKSAGSFPGLAAEALHSIPEIKKTIRIDKKKDGNLIKTNDNKFFRSNGFAADPGFFNMFPFRAIVGDLSNILQDKSNIVIDETLAQKCFGDQSAMGKTLQMNGKVYTVAAVVENVPSNSHLQFQYVVSTLSLGHNWHNNEWGGDFAITYFQTIENANIQELNDKLTSIVKTRIPRMKAYDLSFILQPVKNIPFDNDFKWDNSKKTSKRNIYILSVVAFLILFIACVNFTNLFLSSALKRKKEIGIKVSNGANKATITKEYLVEVLLYVLLSFAISLLLCEGVLPFFNALSGSVIKVKYLSLGFAFISIILIVGSTLLAGVLPAMFLYQLNIVKVIKGSRLENSKAKYQKILVTTQFVITTVLIFAMITIFKQVDYLQNKNLGFNKENTLYVFTEGKLQNWDEQKNLKSELLRNPSIKHIAFRAALPTEWANGSTVGAAKDKYDLNFEWIQIDEDYFDLADIEFIEGSRFRTTTSDSLNYCIINEKAAELLGFEAPYVGRSLYSISFGKEYIIKGVTRNLNTKSLAQHIDPCLYTKPLWASNSGVMMFKIGGDRNNAIKTIESYWAANYPDQPFDFHFLDDTYDALYRAEEKTRSIISWFTFIALLLTSLGLFAMVHFISEQRTKEIGIRKVNGAKISEILAMLNKDFIKWVAIAFVLACPIAYYAMNKWLENFAYKTELSWWIFALAGVLALGIALLTVSWQSWRAATRNPVEALRYE
ncbi:FtsX-like permease family protein [Puteibacter caeruleilacunae]|nr:FtsX-like permease family protein [Puteibacter caeruleilacunae]